MLLDLSRSMAFPRLLAAIGNVDRAEIMCLKWNAPGLFQFEQGLCFSRSVRVRIPWSVCEPQRPTEDLLVTLFFDGGHYKLPVHLAAKQSAMFNLLEIIKAQSPDADGNTIPSSITRAVRWFPAA